MKIQPFILCCPSKHDAPNKELFSAFTQALMKIQVGLSKDADLAILLAPEFFLSEFDNDRRKHAPARDGYPALFEGLCEQQTQSQKKLLIIPGTTLVDAPNNAVFNRATLWSQGAQQGTAYKKFAPKNEITTLPRLINGAPWPDSRRHLLGGHTEAVREDALQNPQLFVEQLDIFSVGGVRLGVEICNDIGFMKNILVGAEVPPARWPDVFVMPSGGMTSGNAYVTNVKDYLSIRGDPLTGWLGGKPVVKPGSDNMLGEMAVRPGGLVLQCDGPVSICGVLDAAGTSFTMHKPTTVVPFGKMGPEKSYARQPLALHMFDPITLG